MRDQKIGPCLPSFLPRPARPRRSYRPIQSVECPDLSARPNLAAKSRRVSHRPIRPPTSEHTWCHGKEANQNLTRAVVVTHSRQEGKWGVEIQKAF